MFMDFFRADEMLYPAFVRFLRQPMPRQYSDRFDALQRDARACV
jgi:hypothetical protein